MLWPMFLHIVLCDADLFVSKCCKFAYRSRNHESGEQVPKAEEEGHGYARNLGAWSQCNNHHPVHCEVDEAHQNEVVEPQKICCFPLEPHHGEK